MQTLLRRAVYALILLCSVCAASAQVLTPATQTGDPINTSSIIHGVDSVNTMGFGLKIEIPLLTLQERGRTYTWKYVFNSPSWELTFLPTPETQNPSAGSWVVVQPGGNPLLRSPGPDNWLFVTPTSWYFMYDTQMYGARGSLLECPWTNADGDKGETPYTIFSNFRLVDPEGTQHPVAMSEVTYQGTPAGGCDGNPNVTSPTVDGSGAFVDQTQNAFWLKDGTKYPLTPFTGAWAPPSVIQTEVEDANGNLVYGDMMQRQGLTVLSSTSSQTIYQYTDSNGAAQTITVNFQSVPYTSNLCNQLGSQQGSNPCTEASGTYSFPQSILLPNQQSYQFTYNLAGQGELLSMTLPTGAVTTYTYNPTVWGSGTLSVRGGTGYFRNPLYTRTETLAGQTNVWKYTTAAVSGGTQNTVQDPNGNCIQYLYGGLGTSPTPVLYSTTYQNGCGTSAPVLKTVTNTYAYDEAAMPGLPYGVYNSRPTVVTTTLDNGLTSQVQTDYETFTFGTGLPGTWMNPTEVREYDYGASSPTRTTDYTYLHNVGSSAQPASAYQSRHIVDKIASKTVSGISGQPAASGQSAPFGPLKGVAYDYDNYGTGIAASGAVQHDTTYGNWGNVTTQTVSDKITGLSYASHYKYEDTGNMIQSTDPLGNITTYDYTDNWSDTTCAVPNSGQGHVYLHKITNALSQYVTYAYNSCVGTLASIQDINQQPTRLQYDELGRTLFITYPDGGGKSFQYNDTASPVSMIANQRISKFPRPAVGYVLKSVTTLYDGLGRATETQLTTDPFGTDFVDTAYDGLGQKTSVSNPYRSSSDPSYGFTLFSYDGLGRMTQQQQPDTSKQLWSYSGNVSVFTDEVGNQWQRTSDALGRLTQVLEPNGSSKAPSMATSYTYDGQNNLLTVTQTGNSGTDTALAGRSFVYDGLSQLICASNPENSTAQCPTSYTSAYTPGTTSYKYDSDGNLTVKESPGVNGSNNPQYLEYCYDALNRLVMEYAYAGVVNCSNPASTDKTVYAYDGNLLSTSLLSSPVLGYAKGHLTDEQRIMSGTVVSERSLSNF